MSGVKNHFDDEVEKLLENVAKEEGLRDYKIERAPGSMKGDGYLGVITAVQITGTNQHNQKKTLSLVVKTASKSDALREETPIANVFEREIYMYNVVIPEFRKFEAEKGVPSFSSSAKCYKACIIDKSEALVLENLRDLGYSVWERRLPMEDEHVRLVMAEYGRFHALTYAMRDQEPARFEKLTASMDDIFDKFILNFAKTLINQSTKALDSLNSSTDSEAIQRFKAFAGKIEPFLKGLPKLVDQYSTIIHGDCWTNNMMFKYEDKNNPKKPTSMCLIDLQLSRLGSPVLDLSYFFYACTSKKVISNWEQYLDVYYDSFSGYLKKLGTNSADVYPYSVFRQHWKEHAKFGLLLSVLLIYVMLSEQNEVTDLADVADSGKSVSDAFNYSISNISEYNDRVRHIILHFVKNKFI